MKALPCKTATPAPCKGDLKQQGLKLLGRPIASLPGGLKLYLVSRPSGFPLRIKCGSCKRPSVFSAAEFNALPELTVEQLEALGELKPILRDWQGDGHTAGQAQDLMRAGLGLAELRALPAPEPRQ